eukprot:95374-Prymnesium_polylepis.1
MPGLIGKNAANAVTFVDNHDTARNDRFGDADALKMAYALLLTHPGTPCVFWGEPRGLAAHAPRAIASQSVHEARGHVRRKPAATLSDARQLSAHRAAGDWVQSDVQATIRTLMAIRAAAKLTSTSSWRIVETVTGAFAPSSPPFGADQP